MYSHGYLVFVFLCLRGWWIAISMGLALFLKRKKNVAYFFLGEDLNRVLWAMVDTRTFIFQTCSFTQQALLGSNKHGNGRSASLPHQARTQDPFFDHRSRSGLFSLKRSAKEVRRRCAWMIIPPSFHHLETTPHRARQ